MTHPFHPLRGRTYELISYRRSWGEHRVYFYDEAGKLRLLPAGWTDVVPLDAYVEMAAGRSHFRIEDLLRLAELIEQTGVQASERRAAACKGNDAVKCKDN